MFLFVVVRPADLDHEAHVALRGKERWRSHLRLLHVERDRVTTSTHLHESKSTSRQHTSGIQDPPLPREEERKLQDDAEGTFLLLNIQNCESFEATQTKIRPMTDVASQGQEESGYREVKGEASGMEGERQSKVDSV